MLLCGPVPETLPTRRPDVSPDGVNVRPYEPRDLPAVAALSDGLSPRSLYQRFFTGYVRLPTPWLDRLDRGCDGANTVLLAVVDTLVVGVGELVSLGAAAPLRAELALIVHDGYQRQGIGRRLTAGLLEHARVWDVTFVAADVLSENRAVAALLRAHMPYASVVRTGPTTRYELRLDAPSPNAGPPRQG